MALTINDIVRVSAQIIGTGLLRREFGRTLFVTTDTTLAPQERTRTYPDFPAVKEDYGTTDEPYKAGNIYFQQDPYPKNLIVGRWITTQEDSFMFGGAHTTLAAFQAISDGSLGFNIGTITEYGGTPTEVASVSGIDLSTALSFTDVASLIDTAIKAVVAEAGYTFNAFSYNTVSSRFEVSVSPNPVTNIVTITPFVDVSIGTDLSELLAMSISTLESRGDSTVPETIEEALDAMVASDGTFYFITHDQNIQDTTDADAIAAWTEPLEFMYCPDSVDFATLIESNSVFTRLSGLEYERTMGTWSKVNDYKGVSAAARFSSVNFDARNSVITMNLKDLPGTTADDLTAPEVQTLKGLRSNIYINRDGIPGYEEGYTFDPDVWSDVRYWLDWFINAVRVYTYNALKTTPTKVPQTEDGMNVIKEAITLVCEQGKANGGIAGGLLSPVLAADVRTVTGNASFDGTLADGYLVFSPPISTLSQNDRNQRKTVPTYVWLKGSGAIHNLDIIIKFEN